MNLRTNAELFSQERLLHILKVFEFVEIKFREFLESRSSENMRTATGGTLHAVGLESQHRIFHRD